MRKKLLYRLEGKTPVPTDDAVEWAESFKNSNRIVSIDNIESINVMISTVFLGMDHNLTENGPPFLFETMVFYNNSGVIQKRYSTWEEAEKGHKDILKDISDGGLKYLLRILIFNT